MCSYLWAYVALALWKQMYNCWLHIAYAACYSAASTLARATPMGPNSMGSLVYPILANLYMEEVESRDFTGTAPSHWFRNVDDTWVKIRTREVEAFRECKCCGQYHQVYMRRCQRRRSALLGLCSPHWRKKNPQCWGVQICIASLNLANIMLNHFSIVL